MKTSSFRITLPLAVLAAARCFSPLSFAADSGVTFSMGPSVSGDPNAAIMTYLGDPVLPPGNIDPKYTKEAIAAAFQKLCQSLGYSIDRFGIDDREYPFLVYARLNGNCDYRDVKSALASMPGYAYSGSSTGSGRDWSYIALNMVPSNTHPRAQREAIDRRMMIRLQMLAAVWREPAR
jgi:hypothetical protein